MFRFRRFLAAGLCLSLALAPASCGSGDLPTSASQPAALALGNEGNISLGGLLDGTVGGLLNGLLSCNPQPYARAQKSIGPAGGTLAIGRHLLVIPAGALNRSVVIVGESPGDSVASVRFSPEGLQFATGKPARLTLDYSSCPAARLHLLKRVAYTTEKLTILSYLKSLDNLLLERVSADVQHFSRYAVAW